MKSEIVARTEAETLATFKEEIPSQYFSHLNDAAYADFIKRAESHYRDQFKFPPKMFSGARVIDFGAGTGENTVYLANWGATCTLVEMNENAQAISKEVFSKYAKNKSGHTFVHSSIFDYNDPAATKYDIVHCRGVLSHTADKEGAFKKIAGFTKPGGYLIFGDPNKAGGFQNMLQRYAVYQFAKTNNEMVDVCEFLYKEDIDRSEKTVPRTRRAIIFDRWVIQSQDDPSVAQVVSWAKDVGMRIYSVYPHVLAPVSGDSYLHRQKLDPYTLPEIFSVAEATWMMQTAYDSEFLPAFSAAIRPFAKSFADLTSYMENFSARRTLDSSKFTSMAQNLAESSNGLLEFYAPLRSKLLTFLNESQEFVKVVQKGNLKDVRAFIEGTKHLFRGACGVRHIDFICYRPEAGENAQH